MDTRTLRQTEVELVLRKLGWELSLGGSRWELEETEALQGGGIRRSYFAIPASVVESGKLEELSGHLVGLGRSEDFDAILDAWWSRGNGNPWLDEAVSNRG